MADLGGLKFEWDENKNIINKNKHKISFVIVIEFQRQLLESYRREKQQKQKQVNIMNIREVLI